MIRWMVAAAGLLLAACGAPKADALGWFGNQDNFDVIQPIVMPAELKAALPKDWSEGADLTRHSSSLFVGAGVWVTDKGYAIKLRGYSGKFIQLDDKKIASFQALGVLPATMPEAGIAPMTYAFGYSLWILVGVFGIFFALSPKARQRFVAGMAAKHDQHSSPAPAAPSEGRAPAWQAGAIAAMDQARSAAARPAAAPPPVHKAQPLKALNLPMVEGGPRGFGRKR